MEEFDSNLDDVYHELADRFGALSRLFAQLSSVEAAQELLDSLIWGDAAAFNRLIDQVDIPIAGKCAWVQEIIGRVVVTPTGLTPECWLRNNLTPSELGLYIAIASRHRQLTPTTNSLG